MRQEKHFAYFERYITTLFIERRSVSTIYEMIESVYLLHKNRKKICI